MKNLVLVLLGGIIPLSSALAVPQETLSSKLEKEIIPYIKHQGKMSEFSGVGNVSINYLKITTENPQGVIIVSPGQGEPLMKYAEVFYDLRDWGFDIYAIDHRGQGDSGRLLPDSQKSHVENFSDYVEDFTKFVTQVVKPQRYKNSAILAHSMGGAIATGFLLNNPWAVKRAVLMAPMLEINTGGYNENLAYYISRLASVPYLSTVEAPGQHALQKEYLTSSDERFKLNMNILEMYPKLLVGATTLGWVKEAFDYTKMLREKASYQIPVRMFTATQDKMVVPLASHLVCGRSPQCQAVEMPKSEHEILMENDTIRDEALRLIFNFINGSANTDQK